MKILLLPVLVVLLFLAVRGGIHHLSNRKSAIGPASGQLAPCPDTPNCYAVSVTLEQGDDTVLARIESHLRTLAGVNIERRESDYVHATFKTRLMGYTDDVEILVGPGNSMQLRSASRIGHSDLGANKKRVLKLLATTGLTATE